jgi:glutamate formiminotransferase
MMLLLKDWDCGSKVLSVFSVQGRFEVRPVRTSILELLPVLALFESAIYYVRQHHFV